ncbi:MAG: hypothetical protein M3Y27_21355 [Acidobacteriota bacterium]|nr:hypothetical protein [Acidobacteriota bacterium]
MTVEERFKALEETMQRIAVRHEQLVTKHTQLAELHLTLGQIAEMAHARLDKHDEVLDRIEADISILIKMNLPPQNGKTPER